MRPIHRTVYASDKNTRGGGFSAAKPPKIPHRFHPPEPAIFLLTGPRGVGKTTVCLRAVALAQQAGFSCAGLLTLREDEDQRVVVSVRTGLRRPLTTTDPAGVRVGRFLFDPAALAWGAEILAQSTPCDLLVVDELGPLELRGEGWAVGLETLRRGAFRLGLVVVRPELVEEMLARFPHAYVLEVTLENRDDLPGRIIARI